MKLLSTLSMLALLLAAGHSFLAHTQQLDASVKSNNTATPLAPVNQLTVAELFTSQGCSSCPAAEQLFSKLAKRDDLLTMEWHVDYWDRLVHHGSKWKDPYSQKAFTKRQRSYNQSLRGKNASYTPQAVVNGHFEGVGSRPAEVSDMIENVPALSVPVQIINDKVIVGASAEAAEILFVRLLKRHETDVKGGENKGRKLSGHNIVLEAVVIGELGATATELALPDLKEGETCAVLVQTLSEELGPVMGAAKCV